MEISMLCKKIVSNRRPCREKYLIKLTHIR